jgi:hypothetical protein
MLNTLSATHIFPAIVWMQRIPQLKTNEGFDQFGKLKRRTYMVIRAICRSAVIATFGSMGLHE